MRLVFLPLYVDNENASKQKQSAQPIFRASVVLSIPNFAMVPGLDEVQQTLNKAVDYIVSVMKRVEQWSKERISKVCAGVFQITFGRPYIQSSVSVNLLHSFFHLSEEKDPRKKNGCFKK